MAYICDDCKYIFPSKRSNCPYCGGRVYNSTLLEKKLLNDGYLQAPIKTAKENHQKSENPYDDLRQAFFNTQVTESSKSKIPNASPKKSENLPHDDKATSSGNDYFSQFSVTSDSGNDIPTVEVPPHTQQPEISSQNDPYERELQELELQRRRLDRQYRRREALNFISNISWRTVIRITFAILLIIIAVTIWQMRYVILNSIINFLMSLLPIIIIIWILWYIFRSFFG